jgi:hypothetical protein
MRKGALPDAGRRAGSPVTPIVTVGFPLVDKLEHGNRL